MIDAIHLLTHVIRPVLKDLALWSVNAERLVLGTACQESECGRWLRQLGDVQGGGLGIYQMEPATHDDLWEHYLRYNDLLRGKVGHWGNDATAIMDGEEMIGNLYYATAMCRVHYLRVPEAIPGDLPSQAAYWKKYYNTVKGKGTVDEYIANWRRFVPGDL